jgi:hypothetical protein
MRKSVLSVFAVILGVALTYSVSLAGMDHPTMDHSKMDHSKMDHGKKSDDNIVETKSNGYNFKFKFIDLLERAKGMDMGDNTHHLMVYVSDESGKKITDAKVKFKLFAPNGKESEAMAMGMGGGYGADVSLKEKGKHGIATLVKMGDKKELVKIHYETK